MRDVEKSGGLAEFGPGEVGPGDLGEVVVPDDPDDPTVVGEIPDRRVVIVGAVLIGICAAFIAYALLGGGGRGGGSGGDDGPGGAPDERPARTASAPYRVTDTGTGVDTDTGMGADTGMGTHADRSR